MKKELLYIMFLVSGFLLGIGTWFSITIAVLTFLYSMYILKGGK